MLQWKWSRLLGGLVSRVLRELNVKFLFVPESAGNLVQQIWSAPYVRPVAVTVPWMWLGCKAACVREGSGRHRKQSLTTLTLFLIVPGGKDAETGRSARCLKKRLNSGAGRKNGDLWQRRQWSRETWIREDTQSPKINYPLPLHRDWWRAQRSLLWGSWGGLRLGGCWTVN